MYAVSMPRRIDTHAANLSGLSTPIRIHVAPRANIKIMHAPDIWIFIRPDTKSD
jgi:hypothetical protein